MISIVKAGNNDALLLSQLAERTFIQSHGKSAPQQDITNYIAEKYSPEILRQEISEHKNIYHIIYAKTIPAGYSKIVFDSPYENTEIENITKLERLYLLDTFYGTKLGSSLFQFNIDLAKQNNQAGIWLYVWKENERAVSFYKKCGFKIIGSHDFKISATHANPNHQMLLLF